VNESEERSAEQAVRPRERRTAPPLAPVLRYYGPWLVAALLVAAGVAAHLKLAARVASLEAQLAARESIAVAAPRSTPAAAPARDAATPPARGAAPAAPATPPAVTQTRTTAPPRWACDAQLDEGAVRATIGRDGRAVLACIATRRTQTPSLTGRLDVRLRVGSEGRVEAVHVGGVADDALIACVGRAALAWTFPAPGAGRCAVVAAPFLVDP
jgi:hypothetical protein